MIIYHLQKNYIRICVSVCINLLKSYLHDFSPVTSDAGRSDTRPHAGSTGTGGNVPGSGGHSHPHPYLLSRSIRRILRQTRVVKDKCQNAKILRRLPYHCS